MTGVDSGSEKADDEVAVPDSAAPVQTIESAPDTSSDTPTTAGSTVPTTPFSPKAVVPSVADAVPMDYTNPSSRVVAHGDGFVQLRVIDGVVAILGSDDGVNWERIESTPELAGFPQAVSDGNRIVALTDAADGSFPTPWLSEDGGATWAALALPPRTQTATQFVVSSFFVGSMAVNSERIVLVGTENERVDWPAYSRTVLGEDHGQVTGEGGDPSSWTVSFEDGFEATVDLIAAGLPMPSPPQHATVLTHDGTEWLEPADIPLSGPDLSTPTVVAGPAGFVVVTNANSMVSTDGVTWKSHPLPVRASGEFGQPVAFTAVGGPLGYVLAGSDVLYHSVDAVEWREVHRFENRSAPEMISPAATNPSAGGAGFVIPLISYGVTSSARYLWSSDGLTWTEKALPNDVTMVDSAASSSLLLVLPFKAPDPTASMPTLPATDEELRAAIAKAFYADEISDPDGRVVWTPRLTESDAACIGDQLVAALGADRLRELRFGVFPFTLLGYGLTLPIEIEDATVIAATLRDCSADWELLMITSVTGGADQMSDESARCAQNALADDVAEEIFAIELARPYDDQPTTSRPDLTHLAPLAAAFQECLSAQELNAIDWD